MEADHDYYHEEETGEDETPLLEENACRTIKQKVCSEKTCDNFAKLEKLT